MADSTIASLTDGGTGLATDILYTVRDPSGTPLDRKLALSGVRAYLLGTGMGYVIGRSFAALSRTSVNAAGDANETQLVAVTIPANTLGANGFLRVTGLWSYTNSATTKTMRVRFGAAGAGNAGIGYHSQSATTTATQMQQVLIANRNATGSQVGPTSAGTGGWSTSATTAITSSIDTTAATEVHFGCAFGGAASAQTITLEGYVVEVFPA